MSDTEDDNNELSDVPGLTYISPMQCSYWWAAIFRRDN